jgi:hypothetical protein
MLVIGKDADSSVGGALRERAGAGAPRRPHVSGPRDPGLYLRTLEAAATIRRGLELLQELAEKIEGTPGPPPYPRCLYGGVGGGSEIVVPRGDRGSREERSPGLAGLTCRSK